MEGFRTAKELKQYLELKLKCDKEAKQSAVEYQDLLLRQYYDEHPTEAEANRIHAGADMWEPESE